MAKSKTYYNSSLGFNGKTPGTLPSAIKSSATHVFDPDFSTGKASDPLLNLRGEALATAQRNRRSNNRITYNSTFDIDGKTPGILPSALKSSATHVFDPDFSIGQASDPLVNLRGEALATAQRNRRSNNTITYDSVLDIDGKTPGVLPSALKSSATHVFDPDFSTGKASDPLLNLRGKSLVTAQRNRRSNNTITYDSVLDIDGKKPPTYKDNPPEAQAKF